MEPKARNSAVGWHWNKQTNNVQEIQQQIVIKIFPTIYHVFQLLMQNYL